MMRSRTLLIAPLLFGAMAAHAAEYQWGDLEGTFALFINIQGVTIDTVGELTGTYDPAAGTMTGTGFGATTAGPVSGPGEGGWTATVDPAAGTIVGGADGAVFELTFTPYAT